MTTGGEGGMVTTSDRNLWSFMWSYKDHGKSWEAVYERPHPPGPRLVHDSFGTNWRMIEMQAAIGLVQLGLMESWSARRTWIASVLRAACEPFSDIVRIPVPSNEVVHAWYRFYAFVRPEGLAEGWSRDRVIDEIVAMGVPCFHGSASEIYLESAFDGTGWRPRERLPVARQLGDTSMAFLVHPTLTDEEVFKTCTAIRSVLTSARGR
jgi:dTDP-4-amino-4,6-dideoxygalactose transaminase